MNVDKSASSPGALHRELGEQFFPLADVASLDLRRFHARAGEINEVLHIAPGLFEALGPDVVRVLRLILGENAHDRLGAVERIDAHGFRYGRVGGLAGVIAQVALGAALQRLNLGAYESAAQVALLLAVPLDLEAVPVQEGVGIYLN